MQFGKMHNRKAIRHAFLITSALALGSLCCLPDTAWAADLATTAMTQFKAKQYNLAAESFRKAIAAKRSDANLYYYYALCLHYNGDINGAKAIYNQIMQYFPGTPAAEQARTAIGAMSPGGPAVALPAASAPPVSVTLPDLSKLAPSAESTGPSVADLPDEAKVYFKREATGGMIVGAKINGRPIDVIFDTGAEVTLVGKNHLRSLGIPLPMGKPSGMAMGVGGGPQKTWMIPCTVTVGSMERKNVRVCVQEELDTPLLGQNFYQGMTYAIDNNAKSINFTKNSARAGSSYENATRLADAVPFKREGKEIIVDVKINGKNLPMFFDTGCDGIHLTSRHAKSIGLVVPDDAPVQSSTGIGGVALSRVVNVSSISLGQIEKHGIDVTVDIDGELPHPLLGQTFFGDCHYSIDEIHHVIHLRR